jgi:hypothetical protein
VNNPIIKVDPEVAEALIAEFEQDVAEFEWHMLSAFSSSRDYMENMDSKAIQGYIKTLNAVESDFNSNVINSIYAIASNTRKAVQGLSLTDKNLASQIRTEGSNSSPLKSSPFQRQNPFEHQNPFGPRNPFGGK